MTNIIILSSVDRNTGTSSDGNLKFTNTDRLNGTFTVKRFIMTNSLYNVNNDNNTIYFDESATLRTAILTNGVYSASELESEIKTAMDAVAAVIVFTVTYNPNLLKYVWSATGNFAFAFSTNTLNSARELLGMNSIDVSPEANSEISDNVIDLAPYKIIYLYFPDASNFVKLSNGNTNSIYISVNSNGGDVLREIIDDNLKLVFSNKLNITYKIRDKNNNIIDLNGIDWELIIIKDD